MATADYIISNQSGASFRTDLNNTLAAIVSNNSNSSSPSTTYAYQWWADTSAGVLKIRNSANNAWIELFQLDGTLTLEDGSASTPALAFRDDLDTGVFSGGANEFNIATGGTERFVLDSSGNVGIGTTSPSGKLNLATGASTTCELRLTSNNTGSGSGDRGRISVYSSRNDGTAYEAGKIEIDRSSGTEDKAHIMFYTNNGSGTSERMRIDSSGRVLIGLTASAANASIDELQIGNPNSNNQSGITIGSTDECAIAFANAGDARAGSITYNMGADAFIFKTNGQNERLRIKGDGDIVKTVENNMTFRFDQVIANNNKFHNFMYSRSASSRGDCSVIAIGEGSLSQGNIKIRTATSNGAISGGVELINGNTALSGISDIRLKNKISDITDALTNIDKIEPIKYSWKYDTENTPHIGVSAQSVNEVYPELIELTKSSTDESDETDYLSVLHTELIPVCIAAIKELKAKIETLETKVETLEAA